MTHEEFVDIHVEDLQSKLPKLLAEHGGAVAFLREFGDRAGVIVEAAAMLGEAEAAYAKQRIGDLVIAFGERKLRVV